MAEQETRRDLDPAAADDDSAASEVSPGAGGGDPACWLHRLCDSCGALLEAAPGRPCWRCGRHAEG